MFIVWGTRISRRRLGWIADFCPICREVVMFRARSANHVDHVYYLPVGRGTRVRDETVCDKCGLLRGHPAGTVQRPIRRPADEPAALAPRTSPRGPAALAERVALEARIRSGTASRGERLSAIAEAIEAPAYMIEYRIERGSGRTTDSLLALVAMATAVTSLGFGVAYTESRTGALDLLAGCIAAGTATLGLVVLLVYRGATIRRREVRRFASRLLARGLASLRPRVDEVAEVIAALRKEEHPVAMHVEESMLREAIDHVARQAA